MGSWAGVDKTEPTNIPVIGETMFIQDNSISAPRIPYIHSNVVLAYKGVNNDIIDKIIACESGGRHEGVWGDNGKAYGIAQFWEATFYRFAKDAELENPDWYDREQQLYLLDWALENGLGHHWTCYRKLAI